MSSTFPTSAGALAGIKPWEVWTTQSHSVPVIKQQTSFTKISSKAAIKGAQQKATAVMVEYMKRTLGC